jgi:SAM-dependent methyltransferase
MTSSYIERKSELDLNDITNYWTNNASIINIYPKRYGKKEYPEGEDVFPLLKKLVGDDQVLEFGCGFGRLAHLFKTENYTGIDINNHAIQKARKRKPNHIFKCITLDDKLPETQVAFAYAVFFHIPLDTLTSVLNKLKASVNRLIIAEFMKGLPSNYDKMPPCIMRTKEQYLQICKNYGFKLKSFHEVIHGAYDELPIQFLELEK